MRSRIIWALTLLLTVSGCFKLLYEDEMFHGSKVGSALGLAAGGDTSTFALVGYTWLRGLPPYSQTLLAREAADLLPAKTYQLPIYSPYPPSAFPPLVFLFWRPDIVATVLSVITMCVLYGFSVVLLARTLELQFRFLFYAFALNFAPFHSVVHIRNVGGIVGGLILLSTVWSLQRRATLEGVFAGLATSIKPQIGMLFLLRHFVLRWWRALLAALLIIAICSFIGLGWMAIHRVGWIDQYREMLASRLTLDASDANLDSVIFQNRANFSLLNFAPVVYAITHSSRAAALVPWIAFAILFSVYSVVAGREGDAGEARLPSLAFLCAITLVPFYNHYYSAVMMLLVVAMLWREESHLLRDVLIWANCIVFSLPALGFPGGPADRLLVSLHLTGFVSAHSMAALLVDLVRGLPNLLVLADALASLWYMGIAVQRRRVPAVPISTLVSS